MSFSLSRSRVFVKCLVLYLVTVDFDRCWSIEIEVIDFPRSIR